MLGVCLRYGRNRMEAEDILQDAFIRIFDHMADFKGQGSLEGWVRRIVVNTALMYYRSHKPVHAETAQLESDMASYEPGVYADLGEKELLDMIDRLPEGYKVVFNLYVIEGFSHAEIAEQLNITESTSRSQLVKSRKMLQSMILELQRIAV